MLDIDNFKQVNDTHGHAIGDALLRHFAREVSNCLRKGDSFYRVGGEEFLILISHASLSTVQSLGERIRKHIEQSPFPASSGSIHHTVSIGCAISNVDDTCLDPVIERADNALYAAKSNGRNRVEPPPQALPL